MGNPKTRQAGAKTISLSPKTDSKAPEEHLYNSLNIERLSCHGPRTFTPSSSVFATERYSSGYQKRDKHQPIHKTFDLKIYLPAIYVGQ